MMKQYYLNRFEDVFWIITFACGGSIHSSQLHRWLSAEGKELQYDTYIAIVTDWERLKLIRRSTIGRSVIIHLGQAVYRYFDVKSAVVCNAFKLKRTSLIMEKYLTQEKYYQKPPSSLRKRLMKTGGLYLLALGEAQLRILENYKVALEKYQWDLRGIQHEIETMKEYMNVSASRRHFSKTSTHFKSTVMNLYRLTFKSIIVSGATIQQERENAIFTVYVDVYNILNSSEKMLAKQVLEIYHVINGIFNDSNNSTHKVNCITTIYSHQKEDEKLINATYQLLRANNEFCFYDKEDLKRQVRFVFFDTSRRLFGGIKTDSVV